MHTNANQEQPDYRTAAPQRGHSPIHWILGLVTLLLRSGGELTKMVGEIHHTASDSPLPWDKQHQPDLSRAPKPYLWIKILLEQAANNIHRAVEHLPSTDFPQPLVRLRSAMNGVIGDKLNDWNHPLTQSMEVVDELGHKQSIAELKQQSSKGVVLFVHGLCLSEFDWQGSAHGGFVEQLRSQGFGIAWLRYNTGLPMWENGVELAHMLEQQWQWAPECSKRIRLIGHSMGGLIVRSALYHGEFEYQQRWIQHVTHTAYLATPHDGAPLEKIGNMANNLLGNTPYSKPLMALGNIRSRGIRSLRHGNITAPLDANETQRPMPFHAGSKHLLLAAVKYREASNRWLGDGLVPQASAMGGPHFPQQHKQIERIVLDDVGHIRLLQDLRTYDVLTQWLEQGEVADRGCLNQI